MLHEELEKLSEVKKKLLLEEQRLREERRSQIGWMAEQCGVLSLPDNCIYEAFQSLVNQTRR